MNMNLENFKSGIERSLELLGSNLTPENIRQLYFDLQSSEFIVPAQISGKRLATVAAEKKGDRLVLIPVFTNREEFGKGLPSGYSAEIVTYYTLKHLVIDDLNLGGIVINPFGKQLILQREQIEEIDSVTTGMSFSRLTNPGKLALKKTDDYPQSLAEAICRVVENRQEVHRVYLASAIREEDKAPHLMIIFDFDGRETELFPVIAEVIRPHLGGIKNFELIKANVGLLRLVDAAEVQSIYAKQTFIRINRDSDLLH